MRFFSQSRDGLAWIGAIGGSITAGKYLLAGVQSAYSFASTPSGVAAALVVIVPLLVVIAVGVWRK